MISGSSQSQWEIPWSSGVCNFWICVTVSYQLKLIDPIDTNISLLQTPNSDTSLTRDAEFLEGILYKTRLSHARRQHKLRFPQLIYPDDHRDPKAARSRGFRQLGSLRATCDQICGPGRCQLKAFQRDDARCRCDVYWRNRNKIDIDKDGNLVNGTTDDWLKNQDCSEIDKLNKVTPDTPKGKNPDLASTTNKDKESGLTTPGNGVAKDKEVPK